MVSSLDKDFSDIIAEIVAQSPNLIDDAGLIQLSPGCRLEESGDNLGQKYNIYNQ